jgi:MFS family permease
MWHLMFYALFVGIGLGLISSAAFMAIDSYFTTRRGRAVGLAMAGTGLGQMLMPNIVGYLLATYSFQVTTLALAALALNGVSKGSILATSSKVGTMGSAIPANFFLMILYVICSNFFFRRKSL